MDQYYKHKQSYSNAWVIPVLINKWLCSLNTHCSAGTYLLKFLILGTYVIYSEVSNNRASRFIDFFGFLPTYMALLETASLFILGKKFCLHGSWRQIFPFFLQFSVLQPYLIKNMYFSSFEFMKFVKMIAFTCIHVWYFNK